MKIPVTLFLVVFLLFCVLPQLLEASESGAQSSREVGQKRTGTISEGGVSKSSYHTVSPMVASSTGSTLINDAQPVPRPGDITRRPLACPPRFLRDGVYLWRDTDGLWTMYWRGKTRFELRATLKGNNDITIVKAIRARTSISETEKVQVEISGESRPLGGVVQFTATDESIECEMSFNGKPCTNRVFIGSQMINPDRSSITLENRSVVPGALHSLGPSVIHGKKAEAKVIDPDTTPDSAQSPMPVAVSSGGGSSTTINTNQKQKHPGAERNE